MTAKELFDAGEISKAAGALAARLRDHPTDAASRTFLFELLCFSGQYDRAEKQLGVLSQGGQHAELGAVLYYSALHAEKSRHELFRKEEFPNVTAAASPPGKLNGKPFQSIRDADPTIGARLEVFAAGAYVWIPFEHIASMQMEAPRRLRDTLWSPASVLTGPAFKDKDIGEVLIPAIYPFSWKSGDESVWLGRKTEWVADDQGHEYPVGQKMFLVDGEEVPLLEVRSLEFAPDASA
ncbi:MAG TPA: type VI secretion system accessory protein TagJ [Bryobacteraceae bacterium]|nr:type VI secretion system accessory protein TagJ [Bryobacteraceae bacterium]